MNKSFHCPGLKSFLTNFQFSLDTAAHLFLAAFGCHFQMNGNDPVFQAMDNRAERENVFTVQRTKKPLLQGANRASSKPTSSARKVEVNPTDLCIATFSKYDKN